MPFQIHKDKPPEQTIKEARNILSEIGIFPLEKMWFDFNNVIYSVIIQDRILNVSCNGKGTSKIYALASAYAELLERIQNGSCMTSRMGLMPTPTIKYPDKVSIRLKELLFQCKTILQGMFDFPIEDLEKIVKGDGTVSCVPYYNVFDKKVELLPDFITLTHGTNGFCAGNTAEEALCQGICEIFERYIVRKVYNNFDFPTIPILSIKDLEIYGLVEKIIKQGYSVIIKDCTLNGTFPVVSLIIFDKTRSRYLYAFGSDPIFEVALQRCITELFQGLVNPEEAEQCLQVNLSSDQYKNKFFSSSEKQKLHEFSCSTLNRTGELPNNFFFSNAESKFYDAFQNKFKNHKDSLKFLLSIIERSEFKVYIRDVSTLSFPAYSVYIPGMTEIFKIGIIEATAFISEALFVKKCLLNLKKSSSDDIYKCACILESLLDLPGDMYSYSRGKFFIDYTKLMVADSSDIHDFDHLPYLLSLMFFRTKEYQKSFKYLNLYLKERGDVLENKRYYVCILMYFKLKMDGVSEEDIKNNLTVIFGAEQVQEIVQDLSNPEDVFQYYNLPACGDCSSCSIRDQCKYEDWSRVVLKINERIAANPPIKQEELTHLFAEVLANT